MQYIFIHGLGQDSKSWDKTISFMKKPFNVVCPELSLLFNNEKITYANLYQAFSDYCKDISEQLNLCGLSLGGVLALNYAIDNPRRMQSLALIGTQYKMPKMLLKFQNIIFRFMPESAFKNIGFHKKDIIQLTSSMIDLDFSKKLKEVLCDVLVICGEKDSANKKAAKELAVNLPRAKIRFIKNASHEVNIKTPSELASELEIFYQK